MDGLCSWLVKNEPIIQIMLSFISLVATIGISCSIYWLQRHHEKEIEKLQKEQHEKELKTEATRFLIDHEAEREYLPWCVIASSLHRHEKHVRRIYADFCRCSDEVQNAILEAENYEFRIIADPEWVNRAIDQLRIDIENYQLGRNLLYDGAKYFHFGYCIYKEEKWSIPIDYGAFKPIAKQLGSITLRQKETIEFWKYLDQYFYFMNGDLEAPLYTEDPIQPINYLAEICDFGYAAESDVCAWIMQMVDDISVMIHNLKYTKKRTTAPELSATDARVDTYEDKYYKALMALYNTYYDGK